MAVAPSVPIRSFLKSEVAERLFDWAFANELADGLEQVNNKKGGMS